MPDDRKALLVWLGYLKSIGFTDRDWKIKSVVSALRGDGGHSTWSFPTRYPGDLTGDMSDDNHAATEESVRVLPPRKDRTAEAILAQPQRHAA